LSRTSSANARAKAAARKAILEAEAATLKQLHQIEEDFKLRQSRVELQFETELAKAEKPKNLFTHNPKKGKSPQAIF